MLLCENKTKECIWSSVNLLQNKCRKPPSCFGHFLWQFSWSYCTKDILQRHQYQCTSTKYYVLNIWYKNMLKYKLQIKLFMLDTREWGLFMWCLMYHNPEKHFGCFDIWMLILISLYYILCIIPLWNGNKSWPKPVGDLQHLCYNKFPYFHMQSLVLFS